MPSMPGTVTKTRTFTSMDTIWNSNPDKRLQEYASAPSFDQLLSDAVANNWINQGVADHVKKHWLDKYWSTPHPKAEARDVLHRGLYWAMRVAVYHDAGGKSETKRVKALPICCAWVCSGGKPENGKARFEMITLESDQQVTVLFVTPPPKDVNDAMPGSPLQRIWATRRFEFKMYPGEMELERWGPSSAQSPTTRTVRPYDYEDYPQGK